MKIIRIASNINIQITGDLDTPCGFKNGEVIKCDNEKIKEIAKDGIISHFSRIDSSAINNLSKRYSFFITESRDSHEGITLTIKFNVTGEERGTEEMVSEDHPSYDYYNKFHGGKTGKILYKTPKNAIDAIPGIDSLAYRGMSWEEWKSIEKRGIVQSRGDWNIGQEGLTFFSYEPSTAESYTNSFASLPYQITPKTPGVVIAIPKEGLLTSEDRRDIPRGELGLLGSLSSSEIKHVWFLVAVSSGTKGYFDLRIPWKNMGDGLFEADPSRARMGSAFTSAGTSYKIIQKR